MSDQFGDLMKQAQQMKAQMEKVQEDLAKAEVTGNAGAGLVSVTMNGRHDVKTVAIDDSLLKESKEILEDLIAAAFNDAVRRVEEHNQKHMSGFASGFKMPF